MEQFTEYGVRITLPGYSPRDTSYQRSERDAIRAYDHARALHGEDAVEFMSRQVRRSQWVVGKLPPPPDPDGGLCDPTLIPAARVEDAGSVDRRLTSTDEEPPLGTIVRDDLGREWGNLGEYWSPIGRDGGATSWTKVAGNYGPVTVVEWGSGG